MFTLHDGQSVSSYGLGRQTEARRPVPRVATRAGRRLRPLFRALVQNRAS
jgi:hypothetical protein